MDSLGGRRYVRAWNGCRRPDQLATHPADTAHHHPGGRYLWDLRHQRTGSPARRRAPALVHREGAGAGTGDFLRGGPDAPRDERRQRAGLQRPGPGNAAFHRARVALHERRWQDQRRPGHVHGRPGPAARALGIVRARPGRCRRHPLLDGGHAPAVAGVAHRTGQSRQRRRIHCPARLFRCRPPGPGHLGGGRQQWRRLHLPPFRLGRRPAPRGARPARLAALHRRPADKPVRPDAGHLRGLPSPRTRPAWHRARTRGHGRGDRRRAVVRRHAAAQLPVRLPQRRKTAGQAAARVEARGPGGALPAHRAPGQRPLRRGRGPGALDR